MVSRIYELSRFMANKKRILSIFGTRPEAIKMAPIIMELGKHPDKFENLVCITAQHREMLDQVLNLFNIQPDIDLDIMSQNQDLWTLTSEVLLKMKDVFEQLQPDLVLVHGDTTTTMATTLSAFYAKVPVGHVEAGLRTFDKHYPFPEEINRVVTDSICDYYFAPTKGAVENLNQSGIKDNIYMTGNSVIDALLFTKENYHSDLDHTDSELKTILLTSHRRENFGEPLKEICLAVKDLVEQNQDIEVVYPVHLNPNVRKVVYEMLEGVSRVKLVEPLEYAPFVSLMDKSHLILTDSGGVQEEAPSLGKPVLVLRDTTERPEAIDAGVVKLVGPHREKIVTEVNLLLQDEIQYQKMATAVNPYGDGLCAKRIVDVLIKKETY